MPHDPNLEGQGYDLIKADHPSNAKWVGVFIYDQNDLPVKLIKIISFKNVLLLNLIAKTNYAGTLLCIGKLVNHAMSFPVFLST